MGKAVFINLTIPRNKFIMAGMKKKLLGLVLVGCLAACTSNDLLQVVKNSSKGNLVLTYDANGGTGTLPAQRQSYAYGTSVTVLGSGSLASSGNNYLCWNTASDGTGASYVAGDLLALTQDTTLYALWVSVSSGFSLTGTTITSGTSTGNLVIPPGITGIGPGAFSTVYGLTTVSIPATVVSIGTAPFVSCTDLTSITVDPANPNYASYNGALYNKSLTRLIQGPLNLAALTLAPTTQVIGESSMKSCQLSSLVLPLGLTTLEVAAFQSSVSLPSVSIPSSVNFIGYSVFNSCSLLSAVTFTSTAPPAMQSYAFPPTSCTLFVPNVAVSSYTSAKPSDFTGSITGY